MIGVSTVSLFYSLLALFANAAVIGTVALAVAARRSPAARHSLESLRASVGSSALVAAFVVATLATLGSLYFSEVAHFEPCRLCWYQRIAMYPLVVILGIAALRRDPGVRRYAMPLAVIGAFIATYHYALEWLPWLDTGACSATTPCTIVWFREFGFISLPYLALSAFLLILAFLWLSDGSGAADVARQPLAQDGRSS